ncbi:MAG: Hsp20/alpha crystallin family protein [Chloroflexi bacterium]|nr:Hsp20/alpha crystallin family protein [Chloroflexota bacterium]
MAIERWSPFREMTSLREAMDRLFEEAFVTPHRWREREGWVPMDLYEHGDNYIMEVSLPGVRPEDLELSVAGSTVTLSGQVPCPMPKEGERGFLFHERVCGTFRRTVTLPMEVDAANAQAVFEHGLLRLTLPRTTAARTRRIQVRTTETGTYGTRMGAPGTEMGTQPMGGQTWEQWLDRIRQGMDVCDRNRNKIGTVGMVYRPVGATTRGRPQSGTTPTGTTGYGQPGTTPTGTTTGMEPHLKVDTGFLGLGKDLYVPAHFIRDVATDCVVLDVERDRLDQMGWDQRPSFIQG